MRKLTKRKRVKRTKTYKKYRGGDIPNQAVEPGVVDFAKSAASSAKTNISNVGSSVLSFASDKATGLLNTTKGFVWDKTQTAIQTLNNPVAEAKAEHAIDEAGVLATKLTDAVKEPIQNTVNNTIEVAEKAAEKAGPAFVRAGIDFIEAVPVLGTAVLMADEVHQLVKIGDAGLKVAATAAEGVGEVADAVKNVLDAPTPVNTPVNTPTEQPKINQFGGLIRKRKSILRRIGRSVREFTGGPKKNKSRRVKFTPHNTFY
jgi:hypothetical protein